MRRRRIDVLESDLRETIKEEAKGILGILIKLLLNKLVNALIAMFRKKGWVPDLDGFEGDQEA